MRALPAFQKNKGQKVFRASRRYSAAYCVQIYVRIFDLIIAVHYYILQTNAVSLTTEPASLQENVCIPRLVKAVGSVCLGTRQIPLEILSSVLVSVSSNNNRTTVCEQTVLSCYS